MALKEPFPDLEEILASIGAGGGRVAAIDASEGAAGNISGTWLRNVRRGGWAWTMAWKFVSVRSTASSCTPRCEFHSEVTRSNSRPGAVWSMPAVPSDETRTTPRLATGSTWISRRRLPEPVTMTRLLARCGAGCGSSISSTIGKRRRTSIGQPTYTEMLPAAPSLASIAATRPPPAPMEARISSRSGNGSFSATFADDLLVMSAALVRAAGR